MGEWIYIVLLMGATLYWLDSQRVRELALAAAKRFCQAQGLQLLDDNVSASSLRLSRNARGQMVLARIYRFEFSDTGDNRLVGSLWMLGKEVGSMHLPRYQTQTEN